MWKNINRSITILECNNSINNETIYFEGHEQRKLNIFDSQEIFFLKYI